VSKRPLHSNFRKIKQEVVAFGPKHAEHARRVYQSKGTQPIQEFMQIMAPSYRPNYDSMQVSRHISQLSKGSYLLGEHVHHRSVNQTAWYTDSLKAQVPVPVTSQHNETVLKVAKISPREHGLAKKSDVFQDGGCEIDLSNAPIFQILCEISNGL